MSSINNVITTTYRAQGAQALVTASRQAAAGVGTLYNNLGQATRMSERLNGVWRAIGTTMRYAIAGQAVFGMTRMIGQLRDFQTQMGLIAAIGEKPGGATFGGQDLSKLQAGIRKGALDSITPVKDYTDSVINLLSSVQDVPQDQITPIVTEISRAAKLAQVSSEDATKAFTTMNTAFGRTPNLKNIRDIAQQFFVLTKLAPGGVAAGQQIIGQLGQMAQVTRVAGGKPEDMFSLMLTVLRAGIPPSQAGRGVQFFLQTLGLPGQQVKPAQEALRSVGITPGANLTLQERMGRVFSRARQLGIRGNLGKIRNMDEETASQFEGEGGSAAALQAMGIQGKGAEFLGQIFRRIHALRVALAYGQQIGPGATQHAEEDLKVMRDVVRGHITDANRLSKAWQRFEDQAQLQKASVAINAMGLQVAGIFAPVLNFAAGGLAGGVGFAQRHQDATRAAVLGGGGILALLGGRRFLSGGASKGVGAMQAAESLTGTIPTGQLTNPFYVRVIGGIFNTGVNPVTPPVVVPPGAGGLSRESKWNKAIRRIGGAVAVATVLDLANEMTGRRASEGRSLFDPDLYTGHDPVKGSKGLEIFGFDLSKPRGLNLGPKAWHALFGGNDNVDEVRKAQRMFGKRVWGKITDADTQTARGGSELILTVNVRHPDGTTDKRKFHIRPEAWKNGSHPSRAGVPQGRQ